MFKFNPFIFVNGRSTEIHLVDHQPTPKMDLTLFGTVNDRSDIANNIYYRMDNRYPWALDFPRATDNTPVWSYPKEMSIISSAYLKYNKWIENQSDLSWFDSTISGNVDQEELY